MKKVIIVIGFAVTNGLVYASSAKKSSTLETKELCNHTPGPSQKQKTRTISIPSRTGNCTVTVTASMGYSQTYLRASCSSTRPTCDAAITEATTCVQKTLDAAKKNIK